MKKLFAIFLLLISAVATFADQAAYVTKEQAERAVALLKTQKQIKHFCNPCDDNSVRTEDIQTVEAAPAGYQDFWEVKVNGEGIDLAYVYFLEKKDKWKNVAKELHIDVNDVPKTLPKDKE